MGWHDMDLNGVCMVVLEDDVGVCVLDDDNGDTQQRCDKAPFRFDGVWWFWIKVGEHNALDDKVGVATHENFLLI